MKKSNLLHLLLYLIVFLSFSAIAAAETLGIGEVADNLLGVVTFGSNFLGVVCFFIGGSFIFAGNIKYVEYRRNPLMVPISTVVFLFVAGIALICLPFLSHFTSSGIDFSLGSQASHG